MEELTRLINLYTLETVEEYLPIVKAKGFRAICEISSSTEEEEWRPTFSFEYQDLWETAAGYIPPNRKAGEKSEHIGKALALMVTSAIQGEMLTIREALAFIKADEQ